MNQPQRKLKNIQPVIKARKEKLDEEQASLNTIRTEKVTVIAEMKTRQKAYMQGIEKLNSVRTSAERSNLETFENGLDYVKTEWYQLYRKVQEVERREKAQMMLVLTAERDLKAAEYLAQKYDEEYRRSVAKNEQKQLDEIALRRFINNH